MNNQCVAVLRDEMAPGWAAWFCGREVGKRRSIGQGRMPVLSARMRHITTTKCSPTYSATEGSRQRMDVKEVHAGAKVIRELMRIRDSITYHFHVYQLYPEVSF